MKPDLKTVTQALVISALKQRGFVDDGKGNWIHSTPAKAYPNTNLWCRYRFRDKVVQRQMRYKAIPGTTDPKAITTDWSAAGWAYYKGVSITEDNKVILDHNNL